MLTDTQIKKTKPAEKAFKLSDSGGLYLYVTPAGGKLWRQKYRFVGSEKLLSIGPYPAVSLLDARKARDDAKAMLRAGRDPGAVRKMQKLVGARNTADTFEVIAREWFELTKPRWIDHHAEDVIRSLENDVFPRLGAMPIRDITAP